MKILYLANIRLPTEKAHGVQIMKTCEALAQAGAEVTLLVPRRLNALKDDPFKYYGVEPVFSLTRLAVWDTVAWGRLGFVFQSLQFALRAALWMSSHKTQVVYGRDEVVLRLVGRIVRLPMVWETHTGAWSRSARVLAQHARLIVAISQGLKDWYIQQGVSAEKILVAHDGIDLDDFAHTLAQGDARERLGLPKGEKIAMYVGRLDGWKGSNVFLESAQLFKDHARAVLVGGEEAQVAKLSAQYPASTFLGFLPYRELSGNLSAADVFVLPNTGRDYISAQFTSPLKLFAYMAAGKPIVAADLPSIREVLSESDAYFFTPDDSHSLAAAIERALHDTEAPIRASRARRAVEHYTWSARAQTLLEAINARCSIMRS